MEQFFTAAGSCINDEDVRSSFKARKLSKLYKGRVVGCCYRWATFELLAAATDGKRWNFCLLLQMEMFELLAAATDELGVN